MPTDLRTLLAEHDTGPRTSLALSEEGREESPSQEQSEHVLDVDRWGRRRGVDLSEEWQRIDPEADEVPVNLAADAHNALFEPWPKLADNPAEKQRAAWFKQLMETPEYRALRAQTVLNSSLSGLAAKSICDEWSKYADDHPEPKPKERGKPVAAMGNPLPGSDDEPIGEQVARIRSTVKALKEAAAEVETAEDMAAGLGMGAPGQPLDQQKLARAFKLVRGDETLRQILEFAGRAIRKCRALQRTKVTVSRGEIVGLELGGDISRLIPWEMAQVSGVVPELELLALHRLTQRRSLCYRQQRIEKQGAGPIVVTVDESGSMHGTKIVSAKGIALALAWLARQQNRWCVLIAYSGDSGHRLFKMPPTGHDEAELIEWLTEFIGCGSDLDVPIRELPEYFRQVNAPAGKTDVIMLTDAAVRPGKHAAPYRQWAEENRVKTMGIVVGGSDRGEFAKVCDRCWSVPSLDLDSDAVQEVLSI